MRGVSWAKELLMGRNAAVHDEQYATVEHLNDAISDRRLINIVIVKGQSGASENTTNKEYDQTKKHYQTKKPDPPKKHDHTKKRDRTKRHHKSHTNPRNMTEPRNIPDQEA